jgi:molecular chaperone GrpE
VTPGHEEHRATVTDVGADLAPPGPVLDPVIDQPDRPDLEDATPVPGGPGSVEEQLTAALALAETRLADLHRERADFVNFRRRTERDLAAATAEGTARLVEALLPVLDDLTLARDHGDLEGTPFAAITDKLEATLNRFGVESYGFPGEPFDPSIHEALLHEAGPADGVDVPTCVRILQPGYRIRDRVLRPARVAVADPA